MSKAPEVNLHVLDELALNITEHHGQVLSHDPDSRTLESDVYIPAEDGRYIQLLYTSLSSWYVYSTGGRRTKNGRSAYAQNYVRTDSGILVVTGQHYDHLDRPWEPSDMKQYQEELSDPQSRRTIGVHNGGPITQKRAYFLLEAMAIELGE